jgi:hypothetical protein
VAVNFPELDGDERSGEDDREEFGPSFAQSEANTFGDSESGVEESAGAEDFQVSVVEYGYTSKDVVDENVTGINADKIGPASEVCGNVLVNEIERANGDGEEKGGLREFEGGDEEKSTRPGRVVRHILHFTLR